MLNILLTLIFFVIRLIMMYASDTHFKTSEGRKIRPFSDSLLVSIMHQSTIGSSDVIASSVSATLISALQGLSIFMVYGIAIMALLKVRENR